MKDIRIRGIPDETFAVIEAEAAQAGLPVPQYLKSLIAVHVRGQNLPARSPPLALDTGPPPQAAGTETGNGRAGNGQKTGKSGPPQHGGVRGGTSRRDGKAGIQREVEKDLGIGGENFLTPYLNVWKEHYGAFPQKAGLLGKLLKPIDSPLTLDRWRRFVVGLMANPAYFGTEARRFQQFAGTPAAYDDPNWHMSAYEKGEVAKLLEGL
jgi:hypothetical protein